LENNPVESPCLFGLRFILRLAPQPISSTPTSDHLRTALLLHFIR
jgi:hypothetical protein